MTPSLVPVLERSVTAPDGTRIALLDFGGDGPPTVLLHGGGRTAGDWAMAASHLARSTRPIAVDYRGHGRSDEADGFSVPQAVADVEAVINTLELEKPLLAGHSLGGIVAVSYGASVGGCRAVVNVDGGAAHPSQLAGVDPAEAQTTLTRWNARSVEDLSADADTGDEHWMNEQVSAAREPLEALGVAWAEAEPLVRRGFRRLDDGRWQRSPSNAINVSMIRSLVGIDLRDSYRELSCPAMVIGARIDVEDSDLPHPGDRRYLDAYERGSRSQLEELAVENPNITLTRVDTGHMVNLEAPAELAKLILDFDPAS